MSADSDDDNVDDHPSPTAPSRAECAADREHEVGAQRLIPALVGLGGRGEPSTEVQAKREAARRWANHVNAADEVTVTWRYLLLSESDIAAAKGSWAALKRLGT